jgi:hypothetical protein
MILLSSSWAEIAKLSAIRLLARIIRSSIEVEFNVLFYKQCLENIKVKYYFIRHRQYVKGLVLSDEIFDGFTIIS